MKIAESCVRSISVVQFVVWEGRRAWTTCRGATNKLVKRSQRDKRAKILWVRLAVIRWETMRNRNVQFWIVPSAAMTIIIPASIVLQLESSENNVSGQACVALKKEN